MNKILTYLIYVVLSLIACAGLVSCEDKLDYPDGPIEPGISTLDVQLRYKDFTPALDKTRADGDAIKKINDLWLVIYDKDGNYIEKRHIDKFTENTTIDNVRPDGGESSETQTGHVRFQMTIDNGYYRIYAVVNHDLTDEDVSTVEKLKNVDLVWNEDPAKVGENAQMFGWFTNDPKNVDSKTDDTKPVKINGNGTTLHSWVRRAASKVTIAFDTQKLSNNVTIYLKSVTIKDIPKHCYLGASNIVGDDNYSLDSQLVQGETIYFANAKENQVGRVDYGKWARIATGDSIYGLYTDKKISPAIPKNTPIADRIKKEHSEKAPALYFYENMQGIGQEHTVSDKRQDVSGNNSQVSFPSGVNPDSLAWKDAMPNGSYIEVKGYYVNEGKSSPGKGDIVYRFMLGKDEKIDYNAERNHHYMLTMVFNGNANDVDFHIDYKEEAKPGILAQDTAYVSYLYNQESYTNVRATPREGYDLTNLEAYILQNEWRPHDATTDQYNSTAWTMQENYEGSYSRTAGNYTRPEYAPTWTDFDKVQHHDVSAKNTEFGYLSLRKTTRQIYELQGSGDKAQFVARMRKLYFLGDKAGSGTSMDKSKGYRKFSDIPTSDKEDIIKDATDGDYVITRKTHPVNKSVDYIIRVPLFTRAKSIDSWAVYSGANQFYRHHRYARILFIATYTKKANATVPGPPTYQEADTTNILQARRIDNPRAIYRRRDNDAKFDVTLCYNTLTADQQILQEVDSNLVIYSPIISRGAWSVSIEQDPNDMVRITANGRTITDEKQVIYGANNTPIKFTYKPISKPDANKAFGAIILVKYHNLTCTHKIIVRRGYDAVPIADGTTARWSMFNVYDKDNMTVNPLSIGSTFRRYSDLTWPIAEENNTRDGYGVHKTPTGTYKILGKTDEYSWGDIKANDQEAFSTDFNIGRLTNTAYGVTHSYRLPTHTELPDIGIFTKKDTEDLDPDEMRRVQNIGQAFGIAYADGATETLMTKAAYSFSDPYNKIKNSKKGVRGVAIYSVTTGANVFFPFGNLGNPRRRADGYLQYGSVGRLLDGTDDMYRPMAYSLRTQVGGCYWIAPSTTSHHVAIDYNGGNYMSSYLNAVDVYQTGKPAWNKPGKADALPIKLIRTSDDGGSAAGSRNRIRHSRR